jgi:S-DNA-T family DNA segregation ATPase FtsK/SpoIIIE
MTMVRSLLAADVGEGMVPVVLVCPRRSPLRDLEGRPGVPGVPGVPAVLGADADESALGAAIDGWERFVVVVDDAELLQDTPLGGALTGLLRRARGLDAAVVVAGTTHDLARRHHGFVSEARRSRSGLLLNVRSPDDGDLLGVRVPRDGGADGPVGRGLLVTAGHAVPIQAALPG